jgi:hypothetical protein
MKQRLYEIIILIISISIIMTALTLPFYYLWNWLFVKFFWFDYIDYLEAFGFVSLLMLFRFIAFDINTPK